MGGASPGKGTVTGVPACFIYPSGELPSTAPFLLHLLTTEAGLGRNKRVCFIVLI